MLFGASPRPSACPWLRSRVTRMRSRSSRTSSAANVSTVRLPKNGSNQFLQTRL
jgi:hypothetical protein